MTCTVSYVEHDAMVKTMYNIARQASAKLRVKPQHRDDCIQEAVTHMLELLRNGHVNLDDNWKGYLYRAAYSSISNYLVRKVNRWNKQKQLSNECDTASYLDKSDVFVAVRELLQKLPPHYRSVVEGYMEGKTNSEMASERGVTIENIRQILVKALNKMRLYAESVRTAG